MVCRQFPLLIVLMLLSCFSAAATSRSAGASVFVNEVEVLRLRSWAGISSPEDRASALATKLSALAGSASVKKVGETAIILVGAKPWLVVTEQEAKASGSSPMSLANAWAAKLNEALALPGVKLKETTGKVPIGGSRSYAIIGSKVAYAAASSKDPTIAKAVVADGQLQVEAFRKGSTQIRVVAGAESATLNVLVQPIAANFPQTLTCFVTGTPAAPSTVSGAILSVINRELLAVPGAQLTFTNPSAGELAVGDSRTYQVRVRVAGPEAFPNEGIVTVAVRNMPLSYRREAELWYCNDPEQVKKAGRLFTAALKAGAPARMLYHHINKSGGPLTMHVEAINDTNMPARLLVIPGDAEPDKNPVSAGFIAADRFIRLWAQSSAEVITIPPYSVLPISLRKIGREETISGLCYLRLLDDGPERLIVRTEARLPVLMEKKWMEAMSSPTPWRFTGVGKIGDMGRLPEADTNHIYPHPFKDEEVAYSVGGPFGFVRIGQVPIARQDNLGALDGNFGVVYTIRASLDNPTASAAEVEIVYEASAGYGGALFLIDGQIRKTGLLQPKEESRVSRIRLEPGATKSLKLVTIPLSGSSYPCTITIRPVQAVAKIATIG